LMFRSMRKGLILVLCLTLLGIAAGAQAADHLLYFEAQGIAGYSSRFEKPIYYSMDPDAEMQKPSVGFDYLKRFSGETGDWGTFALQGRLALTVNGENQSNTYNLEPQLYNAFFKVRTPGPYVWVGHNRTAFGLSSYFDSHGLILRTLAIQGFGYDRDWGTGFYKDFSWGDISASMTTGTGMPAYFKGNYMSAARISYGVLSHDNYNIGFSLGYGNTLDTMGYNVRDPDPKQMRLAGLDLTILRNSFEHRFDLLAGDWLGKDTQAYFYRIGMNLDPENRFKIEAQPTYWTFGNGTNFQMSLGFSFQVTSNLTLRLAYTYDRNVEENRAILQLYYYRPVL
jgi:opacity protein-like surface antigen